MVVTRPVRRWEHRILCAVLCLLAVLPVLASDEIDLLVRARMQEQRLPGAAYVVMRSGVAVDFGVYGFANLELLVPVTPETVFQVGSLSKQFAARALLMLVDDGKVRLDDPLNRYLPKPVPEWERITLYHVLTHTSGIPNWGDFAEFSFHDDYSAEAYVAILREKNLEFRPGDRFLYSSAEDFRHAIR
jgi:D-alanyl-D-alanine carboxypeptidase